LWTVQIIVRIQAKKLRYAAEFFAAAFPSSKSMRCRKDFVVSLEKRQDALQAGLLYREYRLKRLVAGVSGYICDKCVTKCVAPPTIRSR
jgi:Holliday junction resolvase-like predicted endonuclease